MSLIHCQECPGTKQFSSHPSLLAIWCVDGSLGAQTCNLPWHNRTAALRAVDSVDMLVTRSIYCNSLADINPGLWSNVLPLRLIWLAPIFKIVGGGDQVVTSAAFVIVADIFTEEERYERS